MSARLLAGGVTAFARLVTGVRGNWQGCLPDPAPRIYFANHRSHGDFVLIWTVLPPGLRRRTRPVAAADYWGSGRVRRFIGERVFDAVLVQREGASRDTDPVAPLAAALDGGASLILFPEGTRNTTAAPLLPFKSGLYRLARAFPGVELVPVWIDNLNRVMPKGEFVPVPLLCTVTFGTPLMLEPGEGSIPFRERSRQALLALAPAEPRRVSAGAQTVALFGGIFAILITASLVGFILQRHYAGAGTSATIDNLNARVRAWWVMVVLLGVAFAIGKPGVILLFAFASFAGLREFLTLTTTRRGDHWALAAAFFVVLPVQYYLIWIEWYGLYSIFIPVYVFLLLPVVAALRGDATRFMTRIAELQWGLMIAVFCLSHVPALLTLPIPGFEARKLLLVGFFVLVVQASDVLQYVWGKLLGRHPIAPRLSPSKTVEGFFGGVLSATALGAALWWLTPFSPWHAALMALVITLMGFCGGLVMSALKRDRGVKDWGWMIAGHGGMLDRLDSVIFAAPIFFHLTRYWWTP